jgi:hypothetical protein
MGLNLSHVEEMARVMRESGLKRLVMDGVEMELHDSAFFRPSAEPDAPDATPEAAAASVASLLKALPADRCPCGHDRETEHNESGCLYGCAVASCVRRTDEPDEESPAP